MTWEEAVENLRLDKKKSFILEEAYLSKNLQLNVERFRNSEEFKETTALLEQLSKKSGSLLDIGAGNGISSISFALLGYNVVAIEPDKSSIVGSGAIKKITEIFGLENIKIIEAFGESLPFDNGSFSIVYGRQVMHHANDLNKFVEEAFRVLKPGGLFITVRDHVANNKREKDSFLKNHPLHNYYGGENAFALKEYCNAFRLAGFEIREILNPSSSPINYEPWSLERLTSRFPYLCRSHYLKMLLWKLVLFRLNFLPGRLYSFVALKPC